MNFGIFKEALVVKLRILSDDARRRRAHRRPPPRPASVASRPSRPPQPQIPLPLSVASPRLTPLAVSTGPRRSPSSIAWSIALVERARRSVARDATTTCLVLNYFQIENPAPGGNGVQIDVGDRWQHRLFASTRRRPSHCRRNCPTTAGDGARTARGGGSTPSPSSTNRAGVLADQSLFESMVASSWKGARKFHYVGIDSTALVVDFLGPGFETRDYLG